MDRIRDWTEIQIYVGMVQEFESSQSISPDDPRLQEKFSLIMTNLADQKNLSNFVLGQELETFRGLDINSIATGVANVAATLKSFAFSTAFPAGAGTNLDIDPIVSELQNAKNLETLHISGRTNLNIEKGTHCLRWFA